VLTIVAATILVAAALSASSWLAWWWPLGILLGLLAAAGAARWVVWIVHRDARAVIALWLVFALNRSLALLAPASVQGPLLYMDDIALALALVVLCLTGMTFDPGSRCMRFAYIGFAVFAVSGALGAVAGSVGSTGGFLGTWLGIKLFVCILVTNQFPWRPRDIEAGIRLAVGLIVVTLAVAGLQAVSPGTVSAVFGTPERTRLGATVITSVFREPAQYSTFMVFTLSLLLARYPCRPRTLGGALVVGAAATLSLRLKALVDVVLLIAARVAVSPARAVRGIAPLTLIAGGAVAAYFGSGLLDARLGVLFGAQEQSARQHLYSTGVRIAADNFPIGGGFGSFGSEASVVDYSPLYGRYGLSGIYGFTPKAPLFVHDASWATVLGESGVIGFCGFAVAVAALLLEAWRRARRGGSSRIGDAARAALLFGAAFTSDSLTTPQLFAGFACFTWATLLSISRSTSREVARPGSPDVVQEASIPTGRHSIGTSP
jgi:hypothetical protein